MGILVGTRAAMAALSVMSAMLWASGASAATSSAHDGAQPINAFLVQQGVGGEVSAFTLGLIRKAPWTLFGERLDLYGELSLSRWSSRAYRPTDTGTLVQLALTPVARYNSALGSVPWFVELGIGLTVTSEVYRKQDRQFSSPFNFGDHLAIGWAFGDRREHEISLRVEHFSNGNIKLPNPGENFRALRYVHWFD